MHKSTDLENAKSESGSMKFPPLPQAVPASSSGSPRGRLISSTVMRDCRASYHRISLYSDEPQPEQHPPDLLPIKHKLSIVSTFSQLLVEQDALLEQRSSKIFWCLPLFQSSLLTTVLEDMMTEMRIFVKCNTSVRILQVYANMDLLRSRKYGIEDLQKMVKLEKIGGKQNDCNEFKLRKLDADINKISTVISSLYLELAKESSCNTFFDFVIAALNKEQYEVQLAEDHVKKTILEKELAKQLKLKRNHQKSTMNTTNVIVENLRSQIENCNIITEIEKRYVNKWQAARAEQIAFIHHEENSTRIESTDYFKKRSENEFRVHQEVESFTSCMISETYKKIDQQIEKYDVDVEEMDLKIQRKRNEYLVAFEERSKMEQNFKHRLKEIHLWVTYKKEREKAQEYGKMMIKSAIIVQAWWRGLLVRRKLGPFRVKKTKSKRKEAKIFLR